MTINDLTRLGEQIQEILWIRYRKKKYAVAWIVDMLHIDFESRQELSVPEAMQQAVLVMTGPPIYSDKFAAWLDKFETLRQPATCDVFSEDAPENETLLAADIIDPVASFIEADEYGGEILNQVTFADLHSRAIQAAVDGVVKAIHDFKTEHERESE